MNYGIKDYKPNDVSLTYNQFNPVTTTPVFYEPKPIDDSNMFKMVDKMDAADAQAREKEDAIDQEINKQRKLIHQDVNTLSEFNKRVDQYKQALKNNVVQNQGSYHRALSFATNIGKEFGADGAINAMMQANIKYEKHMDELMNRVQSGKMSLTRYNRLKDLYDSLFNNKFVYDKNDPDRIIGGGDWQPYLTELDNLDAASLTKLINDLTAYQEDTFAKDSTNPVGVAQDLSVINQENVNGKTPYLGSQQHGVTNQRTWLTIEQLNDTLQRYVAVNPNIITMFNEEMADLIYEYDKWQEQLNDESLSDNERNRIQNNIDQRATQIFGTGVSGGVPKKGYDYFLNNIRELLKSQTYDRKKTIISDSLNVASGGKSSSQTDDVIDSGKYLFETTEGEQVETPNYWNGNHNGGTGGFSAYTKQHKNDTPTEGKK